MKWGWIVMFSRYNESWRLTPKLLDRCLRPATVTGYQPLMRTKAHVLLTQLLLKPDQLEAHLHQFVIFSDDFSSSSKSCPACQDR